jgi:RND family efflux transporter MFP subunit
MTGILMNHLWQSTLFAGMAAALTLAFRADRAQVRYWLWFTASLKFLLPFVLLTMIGRHLEWMPATPQIAPPPVSRTIVQINEPFAGVTGKSSQRRPLDWAPLALLGVWACGFAAIALVRWRAWRRVRAVVNSSVPMDLAAGMTVRSATGLLEPGVVGLFRPVLLLPADIMERLSPSQLRAVLAHELCHVRRRDNVTAAIHMLVEAVFWFHPLIWWIGARLVEERERACDEEVLRLGNASQEYAEAILGICKSYVEPPLKCVTAVTGSDLRKRIQAILSGGVAMELSAAKKIALAGGAIVVLAAPVLIGTMGRALSAPLLMKPSGGAAQAAPHAIFAQTKPAQTKPSSAYISALGSVSAETVAVRPRIAGQLLSVNFKEGDRVRAGQLLATIDARRFQIELDRALAQLAQDQAMLADATRESSAAPNKQDRIDELEAALKNDQIQAQEASLQMSYTQVPAPMAGVAGLRSVDRGNMVDPGTTLLVINQLQPISVLFTVAEDQLPMVLLAWDAHGYSLPVEAWNRDGSTKLGTGHLTAVDNQIDQAQGTVKLKAVFDNKDGALFPNQFVMVRLFLNAR